MPEKSTTGSPGAAVATVQLRLASVWVPDKRLGRSRQQEFVELECPWCHRRTGVLPEAISGVDRFRCPTPQCGFQMQSDMRAWVQGLLTARDQRTAERTRARAALQTDRARMPRVPRW